MKGWVVVHAHSKRVSHRAPPPDSSSDGSYGTSPSAGDRTSRSEVGGSRWGFRYWHTSARQLHESTLDSSVLLPEKYVSYYWTRQTPRIVRLAVRASEIAYMKRPKPSPQIVEMKRPRTSYLGIKLREFGETRGWYVPMESGDSHPGLTQ